MFFGSSKHIRGSFARVQFANECPRCWVASPGLKPNGRGRIANWRDKVVVDFMGGGACWDERCTRSPADQWLSSTSLMMQQHPIKLKLV